MPEFSKEAILQKAQHIADMINDTEEVAFFKRAEAQLDRNEKLQQKIAQMKQLQKQAVNLQHYGKYSAQHDIEAQIDAIQADIDNMPIVDQFKSAQVEVNDLLQLVTKTMNDRLTKE